MTAFLQIREGGVALDLDTFVVKPLRSYYYSGEGPIRNDCVLGWPEGQFIGTQVWQFFVTLSDDKNTVVLIVCRWLLPGPIRTFWGFGWWHIKTIDLVLGIITQLRLPRSRSSFGDLSSSLESKTSLVYITWLRNFTWKKTSTGEIITPSIY